MFKLSRFWKAFDDAFLTLDDELDDLLKSPEDLKPGTISETVHEEEVRPDGTRIKRVTRTIRTSS